MIEDRWNDEQALWTMSAPEAHRRAHPTAIMVADDTILQGKAIFAAMADSAAWEEVAMTGRVVTETEDCVVLAYRARAERPGGETCEALCSSTWVRQADGWRLIQHQRTQIAGEDRG